jgi:hypothetical protein
MSTLIATDAMANLLRQATDLTEIRDANGTVLGFFAPVSSQARLYAKPPGQCDAAAPTHDQGKFYTTRQVFERLLSLTKDEKMRAYLQKKIEVLVERDECAIP